MKKRAIDKGLSEAEWAVCRRIAEAREKLGVSQTVFAREIGIPKSTLATYEVGRSPIRFELGLQICRTWIISEEWLATGRYEIAEKVGREDLKRFKSDTDLQCMNVVFLRQCMDLGNHPVVGKIPPGTKFAEAFNKYLAMTYRDLIRVFYYFPRIAWRSNEWELGERLNRVLIERWVILVRNEAHLHGVKPDTAAAYFLGTMIRSGVVFGRKFMGVYGVGDKQIADHLMAILDGPSPPPMDDREVDARFEKMNHDTQPSPFITRGHKLPQTEVSAAKV